MRCSSTHVRAAGHCHPRLLGPIAAVALLAMTVGSVSAAGPTVGAAGVMRSATFTDDMAPAWKTQLLALHTKRDAGMMTAADATAWNNIIDAQGLDPAARISTAGPSASGGIVPMATSRDLTGTQQPQTQTYYCGPASGQSIVLAWHNVNPVLYPTASQWDGASLSQAHLGTATYTNADNSHSTDWGDGDMTRALNRWIFNGGVTYVQYTPTSAAALASHVTTDIDLNMMMAAGTVEWINGSHFNSHPNLTIYHWTTIRGYTSSGSTLDLQDSAANTSVLGSAWANVQPYFSMSSSNGYYYQTQNGATFGIAW